ncbi:two-component system sensor histidine kinase MtrB [Streptosporangium becharense]|uniref:Sensor histidine kinase MtrB n=1 Tax=Streptosporangium becharense TaxID=1816182 RepID=A0A7W9IF14_9ACTN|nr:MtrAB system histidine kinase MtrB [Streptosporangium becharense]MBB2909728.1 two-component system sensor histidine kinase MtrB [Streptosporangium becharense]MBB5819316.1 two-component system sensor histidine kinase MtrB [Streptosporangium becharense]
MPSAPKKRRRTPRQLARGVRRRVRRAAGRVRRVFWRSLQLRVVTSTMVISIVVVAVLGVFLMQEIARATLEAREGAARSEAQADRNAVLGYLNQPAAEPAKQPAESGQPLQAGGGSPLSQATGALARRAGSASRYSVIIRNENRPGEFYGTTNIDPVSIPPRQREELFRKEAGEDSVWYTPLYYKGQPEPVPGLIIGTRLDTWGTGLDTSYEIYHLVPLDKEERILASVQQMITLVGAGLVLLLAAIASLVTRQVVTPVRLARQAAERLAAGRLDERLKVRGEDDLARLATSFNEMAANLALKIHQLEELSQVQRQFVSDVSHELRTPLTTVRMAADLLYDARDDFDPMAARSAELMQNQLNRFEAMLADLLEISRYDAGAADLDIDSVDVRDVVLRAVADSEALAERHSTRFDLRLPGEPCMAEMDSRRVERILRNLLFNAIEHGEGRDVVVSVGADRDAVAVAVRDHGVGLKPGEENLVFDRFWRADPSRARTIGGTGLGLAISREDAMLHGGWLQAWGAPGEGSQFRLSLPRVAGTVLRGSPLPLVPPEVEMRRSWRGHMTPVLSPAVADGGRDAD